MTTILIIEDDDDINNMLAQLLTKAKYNLLRAYSGTEGLLLLNANTCDLVLLDLMLPGLSGEEVLTRLRTTYNMPVIVTSAKADGKNKIDLLKLGADDYIVKPYDTEELLARIGAQLRRYNIYSSETVSKNITYKDIVLTEDTFKVTVNDQPVNLTKREYLILKLLISSPKRVFTKNIIYEQVWNETFFGDENTVNVHISNLRSKLSKCNPSEQYIETVWGIGFKMN